MTAPQATMRTYFRALGAVTLLIIICGSLVINFDNDAILPTSVKGVMSKSTENSQLRTKTNKISITIPQCMCTKHVDRPEMSKDGNVNEIDKNEITCSRQNLALGYHQVYQIN